MNKLKVGDKVRCISDNADKIEPETILTIKNFHQGFYGFEGTRNCLYTEEIEPLNRTIREVKIGDAYHTKGGQEYNVIDVGKEGVVDEVENYWTFEVMEELGFKLIQPEQEKQEIEIADYTDIKFNRITVFENRTLIIELQKLVNKIVKE